MNVVRHAQARTCRVRLAISDRKTVQRRQETTSGFLTPVTGRQVAAATLFVEIIDDGIGLQASRSPGVGLRSMKERAAELGGACTVEPGTNGGTRVFVNLPILQEKFDESTPHPYR
jgi:signal transduction histidine kinase